MSKEQVTLDIDKDVAENIRLGVNDKNDTDHINVAIDNALGDDDMEACLRCDARGWIPTGDSWPVGCPKCKGEKKVHKSINEKYLEDVAAYEKKVEEKKLEKITARKNARSIKDWFKYFVKYVLLSN